MGEKGKAKPEACRIVKVFMDGKPEYWVCAPEGMIMKSTTGAWYRSIRLEDER